MPAKINIERMMHRNSIAVLGETAATYCLVKLIPSGDGGGRSLGLNLALVLDVSGSMYEEDGTGINRLKRVQDAARSAIDKLNPSDTLAIVAFAYNASLLLPPTTVAEKDKILDVIQKIDMYDVDPGGTAMDQGIQLALDAVEKNQGPASWLASSSSPTVRPPANRSAASWPSRPPTRRFSCPSWASAPSGTPT
jgi:hypothetical protein